MIVNIQILRGFAAIMVAWVHCQGLVADGLLPNWAREFGYGGVDLFFVISGYIMVRTTMGKSMSPAIFMKKRIVRIIPLYYFFTLLTALVAISLPDMMNSTEIEFETLIKSLFLSRLKKPLIASIRFYTSDGR